MEEEFGKSLAWVVELLGITTRWAETWAQGRVWWGAGGRGACTVDSRAPASQSLHSVESRNTHVT